MRACAKSRCSLLMVRPTTFAPNVLAANSAKPPQPQPISRSFWPGLQIDRFGKPAVFVVLRGGEIGRAILEQARGIGHARIEPRRIERVADVVMRIDVAARLPPGVAIEPVPHDLDEANQRLAGHHRLHPVLVDAEQIEELRKIGRVPFAAQIGFRNADVAAAQQPRCKTVMVDIHGGGRSRRRCRRAGHMRPSARVTSSVPCCSFEPKPSASRTMRGSSGNTRVHGFRCDRNQLGHGRSIERRLQRDMHGHRPASVFAAGRQRRRSIIAAFCGRQAWICGGVLTRHQACTLEPEPQRFPVDRRQGFSASPAARRRMRAATRHC